MKEQNNPQETLNDIRNMMERSSRFISLSGYSGVFIGLMAIASVTWFCFQYSINPFDPNFDYLLLPVEHYTDGLILGFVLFAASIATATALTIARSKRMKISVWNASAKRLLWNMAVPIAFGTAFCLVLFPSHPDLLLPLSLLFYGLSLFNASNYTLPSIRTLGVIEMILSLICLVWMDFHVLIWTIGFGVMHIIYGVYMYNKFEKR